MFRIILCLNGLQPADWYALRCSCSDCTLLLQSSYGTKFAASEGQARALAKPLPRPVPPPFDAPTLPPGLERPRRGHLMQPSQLCSAIDQPFQTCSASRQRGFVPVGTSVYVDVSMPAFANQAGATIATSAPGIRHSVANWQSIFDDKADAAPSFWQTRRQRNACLGTLFPPAFSCPIFSLQTDANFLPPTMWHRQLK